MKNNQKQYIEYVMRFAEENKSHIWLSSSFLDGTATVFSDVDISAFCDTKNLKELIYGYGKPVYISFTHKPFGILIIIYEESRLLHRSLIKFLSGKQDIGVSVANEVAVFNNFNIVIDKANYRNSIVDLLKIFNEQYQLPMEYFAILSELIEKLDEVYCECKPRYMKKEL